MDRTLEMLETGHVQRIGVTSAMEDWWAEQVKRSHEQKADNTKSAAQHAPKQTKQTTPSGDKPKEQSEKPSVTDRGDSEQEGSQWGGALPGHGGT